MSKAAGEKYLNALLGPLLEKNKVYQTLKQDFRKMLDTSIHVLDISEVSLRSNLQYINEPDETEYKNSYAMFIDTLKKYLSTNSIYTDKEFKKALKESSILSILGKKGVYVTDTSTLITTNYSNARQTITSVCRDSSIRYNKYFGVVNRARTLPEIKFQGYEVGENIASIEDQEAGISAYVCRPPGAKTKGVTRYFDSQGMEISKDTKELLKRELSIFDLGHTFQGAGNSSRQSPLSAKIDAALNVRGNSAMKGALSRALESLADIQANIEYTYTNNIPTKSLDGKGTITLSLHVYNRNNEYARGEGAIYSKLISDMKNELIASLTPIQLAKIPGSNTMEQDIVQVVSNSLISALGKKPKVLKAHDTVTGTVSTKRSNKSSKVISSAVNLGSRQRAKTQSLQLLPQTNLTSLQNLINRQLQHVISANMGNGSAKNVLNYRTGRLAASAQIERMTQSRAGMITAFYRYMKNPYATFSDGGRQSNPKSRDPKLLISKSIREIAQQQVSNRLRAVNV